MRCATWDQVEAFTTRKLRRGRFLSMKVPFVTSIGSKVTIGLELPNEVTIAIDGTVQKAAPVEGDASRTWIEIELVGFTDEVKARLKAQQAKKEIEEEPETDPQIAPIPPVRRSQSQMGDELPTDERALFQHLTAELRRMRTAAVHDVLGVTRDAGPEMVRLGWKDLIRQIHPDLVARRNAPAITHLAEELTILANRAYDRLRSALVAEGRGTLVGPSLATPAGWLVGFEDIQSDPANAPAPKKAPNRFERPPTPTPPPGPPPTREPQSPIGQGQDFEVRARAQLAQNDPNSAREVLAAALVVYPRSKPLRSLYYVATALAALQEGELMLATAQLETALAHHDGCVEASKLLEQLRKHGAAEATMVTRLFR
ncbi:MAG TPA: J domain-containing protein [Kofleriaceae bacterium]|nr:J domain-containing protein [Kofleriaceae bacterium]